MPISSRRIAGDDELVRLRADCEQWPGSMEQLAALAGCSVRNLSVVLNGRHRRGPTRRLLLEIFRSPSQPSPPMHSPTVVPFSTASAPPTAAVSDAFRRARKLRDDLVRCDLHFDDIASVMGCTREGLLGVVCGHGEWGVLHDKVEAYLAYAAADAAARAERAKLAAADEVFAAARAQWLAMAEVERAEADCPLRDEALLVA